MIIQFGKIDLARGLAHRESPERLRIETGRAVQTTETLRGSVARVIDRGNRRTELRFRVTRRHASAEAASTYALTHAAALAQAAGPLVLTSEDGGARARHILGDAAVREVRCEPSGLLTVSDYRILGGSFTTPEPGSLPDA